jgi:hypothetical protein
MSIIDIEPDSPAKCRQAIGRALSQSAEFPLLEAAVELADDDRRLAVFAKVEAVFDLAINLQA